MPVLALRTTRKATIFLFFIFAKTAGFSHHNYATRSGQRLLL